MTSGVDNEYHPHILVRMKIFRKVITVAIVFAIFYFLIASLVKNWQKIPFDSLRFNIISLLVSFIFLFITFLIFVQSWRSIIRALGQSISFKGAFWVMSSSQMAKYVPGGIWFALSRVYLGKTEKLKGEFIALSVVIETGLTFLVGILLFFFALGLSNRGIIVNFLFIIPIFFLFLLALYPPILNKIMNIGLRLMKRPAIELKISYLHLLKLSVFFLGLWVAQIIGYYFLVDSIMPIPFYRIFSLAAAYTLSWMAGFIVVIAPGGLGVREGMMSILLSPILPAPLAIAISFIARIWITVFEIITFFMGLLVKKMSNRENNNH